MQETVKTYAVRRVVKIGHEYREGPKRLTDPVEIRHLVPEAHLFFRQESLVHTGIIQEVEVPIADLFAALELREVNSADSLAILERLGLRDQTAVRGPHGTPEVQTSTRPVRKRVQKALPPQKQGLPGAHRPRQRPVEAKKVPAKKAARKAPAKKAKATTKRTTTASTRGNGTAVEHTLRDESED